MFKFIRIYWHLFQFSLKRMLEYRVNAAVQSLYSVVYLGLLWSLIQLIFQQTTHLAGWSKPEMTLLFGTFNSMYFLSSFIFLEATKTFMHSGIRKGELDMILVKPLPPSLLATMGTPWPNDLILALGMIAFTTHLVLTNSLTLTAASVWLFALAVPVCLLIVYFLLTTYATLAFYITKAEQVVFTFEKVMDFAQYPTSLFPRSVQVSFYIVFPIAIYGYAPASLLLGKHDWPMLGWLLVILITSIICQRLAWKYGLRRYSSVSS